MVGVEGDLREPTSNVIPSVLRSLPSREATPCASLGGDRGAGSHCFVELDLESGAELEPPLWPDLWVPLPLFF